MTPTPTYTIKRLEWEQPQLTWIAQSIFGQFYTASYDHIDHHDKRHRVWLARLQGDAGDITTITSGCFSNELAQAAAEAWYRERLLVALEEVK